MITDASHLFDSAKLLILRRRHMIHLIISFFLSRLPHRFSSSA